MAKEKTIIISVESNGDCAIKSPPDMEIEEVLDILASAVEAAAEKAGSLVDRSDELVEEPLEILKTKDYLN